MERLFVLTLTLIGAVFGVYAATTPTSQKALDAFEQFENAEDLAVKKKAAARALSLAEKTGLAEPRDLPALRIDIADAFAEAGHAAEAAAYYERALDGIGAFDAAPPPFDDGAYVAEIHLRHAETLFSAQKTESAFNALAASVEAASAGVAEDSLSTLAILPALENISLLTLSGLALADKADLETIGLFYGDAGSHRLAIDYLSVALQDRADPPLALLTALAGAYAGAGNYDAAIAFQQTAIAQAEAAGLRDREIIPLIESLGAYQLEASDAVAAIATLEPAAEELDFLLDDAPGDAAVLAMRVSLYPLLAEAYRRNGEEEKATAFEARFAAVFEAAADPEDPTTKGFRTEQEEWVDYTLLYGTTRARSNKENPKPASFYTNKKTTTGERGAVNVSVPKQHEIGEIESPGWLNLINRRDRRKYIVMDRPEPMSAEAFAETLQTMIDKTEGKQAFIFVHGYNTSFQDAARTTAQLSHDLKLDAVPMFYSWPSRASLLGYGSDLNTWPSAREDLRNFIREAAEFSGAEKVHLIAHSMGNKYLLDALNELWLIYDEGAAIPERWSLGEIIFAAPDVEAEEFVKAMSYANELSARTTLYASRHDKALKLSRRVNKGRRAGDSRNGIVTTTGLVSIDASDAKTDFLGHGYFASGESILTDLRALLSLGVEPARRCYLEKREQRQRPFWLYTSEPPQCSANAYDWALYLFLLHGGEEDPAAPINRAAEELIADFEEGAASAIDEEAATGARHNAAMVRSALEILERYFFS